MESIWDKPASNLCLQSHASHESKDEDIGLSKNWKRARQTLAKGDLQRLEKNL